MAVLDQLTKVFSDPELITKARKQLGLSQVELARAAGISPALMNKIELGHRRVTESVGNRIWSALYAADYELRGWRYQRPEVLAGIEHASLSALRVQEMKDGEA
jgi:transcriptional regulator with XRE-family HTH domain